MVLLAPRSVPCQALAAAAAATPGLERKLTDLKVNELVVVMGGRLDHNDSMIKNMI